MALDPGKPGYYARRWPQRAQAARFTLALRSLIARADLLVRRSRQRSRRDIDRLRVCLVRQAFKLGQFRVVQLAVVGPDLEFGIDTLIEVIALAQVLLAEPDLHRDVALGSAFKLHAPQALSAPLSPRL